jgi:hypothetical protein
MADKKYLKRLSDYDVIPATEYLIEPYVPIGALVFVAGLPKTFKTFLSGIDWGYSVATGCQWLGRPTKKGRVLYFALESYHGVLRRAEAWRLFHNKSKADGDDLVYVTDRISFAEKTCSADQHFTALFNAGYRPDLVIIDTWFKVTAGAEVGGQVDMSVALKNLRSFQDRLTELKVEGGLPAVTFVVIAHTDKKGQALFGSITQFADCDVLYQLERVEHANQATLECVGARDIEDPPAITFEMQKVPIITAKGNEQNLVVSKEVSILDQPLGETRQTKQDAKKAAKEDALDDLAWYALFGFFRGPQSWTGWSEWFEFTKRGRGKQGLGNDTFNDTVKRLIAAGRVRQNHPDGLYQIVVEAGSEEASAATPAPNPPPPPTPTPNSWLLESQECQESGVTPGSTPRSARSNSTENGVDQDSVVADAETDAGFDAVQQLTGKTGKVPG